MNFVIFVIFMGENEMEILKQRILKDGVVKEGNVLKVDKFLNHQMDVKLFNDIGEEFARRFAGLGVNKILTIEASASQPSILTTVPLSLPKRPSARTLTVRCTSLR